MQEDAGPDNTIIPTSKTDLHTRSHLGIGSFAVAVLFFLGGMGFA